MSFDARFEVGYNFLMTYKFLGLVNAGVKYRGTRHNLGQEAVIRLKEHWEELSSEKNNWRQVGRYPLWQVGCQTKEEIPVDLFLPETFMNRTGPDLAGFWTQIDLEKLVVVYDDLALPLGRLKIDFGRSSGGHRGLESIIQATGTGDFVRFRLGIAPGPQTDHVSFEGRGRDFVLSRFFSSEVQVLERFWPQVFSAAETLVAEGLGSAQNKFN